MSLFLELKRRNVFRVAMVYGITAWLIAQVAGLAAVSFEAPLWVMKMTIIILILGLPIALLLVWAYELTPEGIRRESETLPGQTTSANKARKLDLTIIIALILAVAYFGLDKFILDPQQDKEMLEDETGRAATIAAAPSEAIPSIAVLPFADMSPQGDQQYIGDGIAEELLDELAHLGGINVAGRTSSFAFRESLLDLKSIGEQLGVTNILEGSIRKQGEILKITAQLINSRNGFHLWSKTYERPVQDIFYVQDDIARAAAGALSVALDTGDRDHLPGTGTDNIDAYDAFMRGTDRNRHGQRDLARGHFQRAVEIDPEYAEAWVRLAGQIGQSAWVNPQNKVQGLLDEGVRLTMKALELNPDLATAWSNLGSFRRVTGDWIGFVEAKKKAAKLAPGNSEYRYYDPLLERGTGFISRAINAFEQRQKDQPLGYGAAQVLSEYYIQAGRFDDARATLEISTSLNSPSNPSIVLRHLFIALSEDDVPVIGSRLEALALADPSMSPVVRPVLNNFESEPRIIIDSIRKVLHESPDINGDGLVLIASLAAYYGDPELALEALKQEYSVSQIRAGRLWYPFFGEMRQLPEFKDLVENMGLLALWKQYGWADYCHPISEDDFECF